MQVSPRYRIFIQEYSKSSNVYQSAVKAGFSPMYANKQGKLILNKALRLQAKEMFDNASNKQITAKEGKILMHELLGLSRDEVFERVKMVADQERDLASKLKVLMPLVKELGIDLTQQEAPNVTVPILSIKVDNIEKPAE